MSVFTGRPRSEFKTVNESNSPLAFPSGVIGVVGLTQYGEQNKPILIQHWRKFREVFGDVNLNSDFAYYCYRALEYYNATLRIVRPARYNAGEVVTATETLQLGDATDGIDFKGTITGNYTLNVTVTETATHFIIKNYIQGNQAGSEEFTILPKNYTTEELASANEELIYLEIVGVNGVGAVGTATLSITEDVSLYQLSDFLGNSADSNGLYAFDQVSDLVAVGSFEDFESLGIDRVGYTTGLHAYTDLRGDVVSFCTPPIGLKPDEAIDFRNGTGTYSHSSFDTPKGVIIYGDFEVTDPIDSTKRKIISGVADYAGLLSKKDKDYPSQKHLTVWGLERGIVRGILDLVHNVGTPARTSEADELSNNGFQYFQKRANGQYGFSTILWDDNTLTISERDTLFRHASVIFTTIQVEKVLQAVNDRYLSQPNILENWKRIVAEAESAMKILKSAGGLYEFTVHGDQELISITQVKDDGSTINTPTGVENGEYRYEVNYAPTTSMKYIKTTGVVNSLQGITNLISNTQ